MNEFERQARERSRILDALRALACTGRTDEGSALLVEYIRTVIDARDVVRAWEEIRSESPVQTHLGQCGAPQD
jgi:hypothetical protein